MPPLGSDLLSLQLGPGVNGFVGPVLQITDQRLDVVQRMKNITAAGNLRQSLLMAGTEPQAEIGDGGLGSEASVHQFQQPDARGIGVAMLFRTQQEVEGRGRIDHHQDGIARLEDLIEEADADAREVVVLVDSLGMRNSAVHDVVHGPQGDPIIEEVTQQFDYAAVRTMADQHQGQGQRTLTVFPCKDLQKVALVPTATAAFHRDALAAGMLFQ